MHAPKDDWSLIRELKRRGDFHAVKALVNASSAVTLLTTASVDCGCDLQHFWRDTSQFRYSCISDIALAKTAHFCLVFK